ncbi:serine/threonine-protein kinase RCK2 [Entomortierella parvispora]|uniref:Serine/threonine-protein kinase RCK2 n=1 Tax=Entomortierella parvispora TaxID=205924 RepID=A0A9P3H704_9FUNG|nr:serine/threonine-protein kinase RCK2 [Entomortierella parvispora]
MALLEQLKNFIRHGKSGKDMKPRDSGSSSCVSSKSKSRTGSRNVSPSRHAGEHQHSTSASSSSAALNQQAVTAAANFNNNSTNTEAASRIVAEEKQQKSKMPKYPGLERYSLVEKMGDGAFSNVYKAYDTKMDRMVAVKVVRKFELNAHQNKHLHRDMKKKPRVTERANILKEVQIMRQLKHSGIVELYEFSESNEHYFLVLELAPGGELFHRIVKLTYFSEELTRHVIVQVAQAVRYLHEEKGVIHRDIKPENILFEPIPIIPSPPGAKPDEDDKEDEGVFQAGVGGGGIGRVKIADFGLSKVVWNEHTMTPCGTVGYTAPEIVKDERYSKSVDMWAMGCVLYTLLCGFPPFYDESIQALTEKVARGQYSFLSPWWDEISSQAKDLITHLLCVNPDERYTIDQFLAHPWIKAGEMVEEVKEPVTEYIPEISVDSPTAAPENKILSNVAAMTPNYGAPKTPYKRRAENPLSPGIGLKEVFDVSNAVHRMEEESTRRRHAVQSAGLHPVDALNTSTRQRQAFMSQLNEEDEMDEEEEGSVSDGTGSMLSDDEAVVAGLSDVHISIAHAQEETTVKDSEAEQKAQEMRILLQQQQHEYQKAQELIAAEHHQKYLAQQQEAGHTIPVQHSLPVSTSSTSTVRSNQVGPSKSGHTISSSTSASTVASTSTTSTSRRRRGGFELNMNQATLLNRRAKNHPLAAGQTVEEQDKAARHDAPVMAV